MFHLVGVYFHPLGRLDAAADPVLVVLREGGDGDVGARSQVRELDAGGLTLHALVDRDLATRRRDVPLVVDVDAVHLM